MIKKSLTVLLCFWIPLMAFSKSKNEQDSTQLNGIVEVTDSTNTEANFIYTVPTVTLEDAAVMTRAYPNKQFLQFYLPAETHFYQPLLLILASPVLELEDMIMIILTLM